VPRRTRHLAGLAVPEVESGLEQGQHVLQAPAERLQFGSSTAAQPRHRRARRPLVGRVQQQQQAFHVGGVELAVLHRTRRELAGQRLAHAQCLTIVQQGPQQFLHQDGAAGHVQFDDVFAGERTWCGHRQRHRRERPTQDHDLALDHGPRRGQRRREHCRRELPRARPGDAQHGAFAAAGGRRARDDGVADHADSPARRPVANAAWKLKPPIGPSTSSSSPQTNSPGQQRLAIVRGSTSSSGTPPRVTSAWS